MRSIYINGGQRNKKTGGIKWKILMFLFVFFVIVGSALKATGPMIVERWINQKGAEAKGYAFSIRDVDISIGKGQLVLNDVKVFNSKTKAEFLEAPSITINLSWLDFVSQAKRVSVSAEKVDLVLSKDFSSELQRVQALREEKKKALYLETLDGKIAKLNVIEKTEDQSRTILELSDVSVKVKELTLLSINHNTEFSISSNLTDGGKLNLTGKTSEVDGSTPWTIHGSLKQIPSDFFNKISGGKLPFSFNETRLNAEINARSEHGKVSGQISPDIKKLNLIDEKPGVPTQTIARALSEDLTFTLPFTIKDDLKLQYADTYRKLKAYRKYPSANESSDSVTTTVSQVAKAKKTLSFWPF